ncbi:helix-turn-helix domain-containing protein [Streptomyces sp. G-G2]|uniref:helix-turn-helix domain-containing protein n=1 Tax=Streptomyces sp. G-G2 TaxID=3046201 RepID=UPI0024BA2DE4|nr:helix-turn-helix domain-containing protein [Streptomyces sp. G-G2]MDJ0383251.1 helix-turn-helix domain-containing protein [Streptomyces sp. G-G2]
MSKEAPASRTIGEKLDYLIKALHPQGRGPYVSREIEALIKQRAADGDPTVTHATISNIRSGKITNPGADSLRALASFFGVPVGYFFDDAVSGPIDERIREIKGDVDRAAAGEDLANALEDKEVRAVLFRLGGLSTTALRGIKGMVDTYRAAEGLPRVNSKTVKGRSPE